MPIELTSTDGRTEDSQLDSLAASGRADAIPVSGSLTPPFRRQVAPQIQPEESQASVEEAHENVVETHIANKSIIEALKECVPKGSTSVLERLIHGRRQRAEAQLLGDGGSRVPGTWTPAAVWEHIGKMKPSDQRVFVIDDIDDEWCEALCTRYPHAINRKFLLEHILGLESARRAKDIHDSLSLELQPELSEVVDLDTLDRAFPCLMDAHEERFGEHIDCWLETEPPEARIYIYEGCKLRLDTSGWTKINCFVSYCRLEENFYLVLTASFTTSPSPWTSSLVYKQTLCLDLRWRAEHIQRVAWLSFTMLLFVYEVLGTHWPFFACKVPHRNDKTPSVQKLVDGFVLSAWTLETAAKLKIEETEQKMRSLAYSTIEGDQERFTQLISFRRIIADCYDDLKRSHMVAETYLELSEARTKYREEFFGVVSRTQPLAEPEREGLKRPLRSHLAKLEAQLDAVKEYLNEEIQVEIDTVQVREAQLMREQAKVTARQTTWTVALTVLAAVYLPMTLVTGIFGMNITEISSEATAPNAWWAFGAWVVIASLTVAGILSYVAISKLKRTRKRKSDLEANDEHDINNDKGKSKAGKWVSKTREDWIRWWKQKAKMVWTPKQE